jgi:hypothetical protein
MIDFFEARTWLFITPGAKTKSSHSLFDGSTENVGHQT